MSIPRSLSLVAKSYIIQPQISPHSLTADGAMRVLYVTGTPYEGGYQHGVLLRDEIQRNLGALYEGALQKFNVE